VRALVQALLLYGLAMALGVSVRLDPGALLGGGIAVVLGAGVFSTFSLCIACLVKTRERFMGIGRC